MDAQNVSNAKPDMKPADIRTAEGLAAVLHIYSMPLGRVSVDTLERMHSSGHWLWMNEAGTGG